MDIRDLKGWEQLLDAPDRDKYEVITERSYSVIEDDMVKVLSHDVVIGIYSLTVYSFVKYEGSQKWELIAKKSFKPTVNKLDQEVSKDLVLWKGNPNIVNLPANYRHSSREKMETELNGLVRLAIPHLTRLVNRNLVQETRNQEDDRRVTTKNLLDYLYGDETTTREV